MFTPGVGYSTPGVEVFNWFVKNLFTRCSIEDGRHPVVHIPALSHLSFFFPTSNLDSQKPQPQQPAWIYQKPSALEHLHELPPGVATSSSESQKVRNWDSNLL